MNPRNGICLCWLHDRAFDAGIVHIKENYTVSLGQSVKQFGQSEVVDTFLTRYAGTTIQLPDRWHPDPVLLKKHEELRLHN